MPQTGSYSVNLLGSIASNLAGLQGYDVMALELIQNADDARASSISFDITDDALVVENNGAFSYCENLETLPCRLLVGPDQYACDFHRITNLASGGKASRSENIGRFGIGFISTYQLCDHPQILSTGIKVALQPEEEKFEFEAIPETPGTQFVLPWATDPESPLRQELRMSAIQTDDLDQMEADIARILDGTLLFLKNLKTAELRRNGQLIRSCKLDRDDKNTILLEFGPERRSEMWLLVNGDASEQARKLLEEFPQLETDDRRSDLAVAFRLDTNPLQRGLFYAFLPTEQLTGLPLHINADFYPEPDRKSVILSGGKHQQRWNEMLIGVAADEILTNLDDMKTDLGAALVWELLQRAWSMSEGKIHEWQGFFWEALEEKIDGRSELAWTRTSQWAAIGKTILPLKELSNSEEQLINELGLELADEGIVKRAQAVLQKLGTVRLSLKRLAEILESSEIIKIVAGQPRVQESLVRSLYKPLWQLIDRTAADLATGRRPGDYFSRLPILLTVDQRPIAPVEAHQSNDNLSTAFAELLPELNLISPDIYQHAATRDLADELTLNAVIECLTELIQSANDAEERFGKDGRKTHKLYRAMADLAAEDQGEEAAESLKDIPIFLTGDGFTSADTVSLPGDFNDPIGFAHILDSRALDLTIENFFQQSVGIAKLEIDSYITDVLPNFFEGIVEPEIVNKLLTELADHRTILDNDELISALGKLPLIPTQDGKWHKPNEAYYKTEALVDVLGNDLSYWVDERRLVASRSLRAFIEQLGLPSKPSGAHLANRVLEIATNKPNEQSQAECERTFYAACYLFDDWKRNEPVELESFVRILSGENCLPAHEDNENWYSPEELYAPYRLEAFSSQAPILPFRNLRILKAELLEELEITNDPETELVVAHLQHCVDTNSKPAKTIYQILNERSTKDESSDRITALADQACIYDESRGKFLRPNQLFWTAPNLGSRALKVPNSLAEYRRLFELLGVKDTPTPIDHLAIASDIVDELGDTGLPLPEHDRRIYQRCLETIANSLDNNDKELEHASKSLCTQACVLNLEGKLCYPDEIAIRDSDWHESYFGDELSGMLTVFRPELQQLYRMLGIQYLSQKVRPVIGQKLGDEPRTDIANRFHDRARCIVRALHDRPRHTLIDLYERLSNLKVVLCDTLDVMFVCELRDPALESPETPEKAHYEASENTLYISTPDIGEFAIPAFNSILHILATSPTGASIPNLVLICELVLDTNDLNAAERKLSAAGFPNEVSLDQSDEGVLEGGELGDLGAGDEEDELGIDNDDQFSHEEEAPKDHETKPDSSSGEQAGSGQKESSSHREGNTGPESTSNHAENEKRRKDRGKKRQDRLLSYVIPKGEQDTERKTDPSIREHNLTVEDRGRAAVVLFEKERGRDAIPQAQENPGWDIVSTDITTGTVRYIEVKAIDGEWGRTGVGLSKLQFSEALNHHNAFWLYVVEYAGYEEKERVYPIQSPATKVTSFMFDHNWRDIADIEIENPHAAFQVDAMVDCGVLGKGRITEVLEIGRTKQLILDFGRGNIKAINLNVATMKVVDETEA